MGPPSCSRYHPENGRLQVAVTLRRDTSPFQWALPGGMVDRGQTVSAKVRRALEEEAAVNGADDAQQQAFRAQLDDLFASGRQVFRGYVDDPRNTDNAWTETTASHFHCSAELGAQLPLRAGDDVRDMQWLNVDRC